MTFTHALPMHARGPAPKGKKLKRRILPVRSGENCWIKRDEVQCPGKGGGGRIPASSEHAENIILRLVAVPRVFPPCWTAELANELREAVQRVGVQCAMHDPTLLPPYVTVADEDTIPLELA